MHACMLLYCIPDPMQRWIKKKNYRFMSAAKEAYSTLTDSERDALRPSTSQPSAMTRKGIIREGVKAFQKIQKEVSKEPVLYRVHSLRACTNKNIPTEVRHKGSDVPTEVRHKGSDVPTEVRHKDSDVSTEVRHKGSDVPTEVKHKGSNVPTEVRHKGSDVPTEVRHKGSDVSTEVKHKGSNVPTEVRHKGSDVANHAPLFLTHIQHNSLPPYYMYYKGLATIRSPMHIHIFLKC